MFKEERTNKWTCPYSSGTRFHFHRHPSPGNRSRSISPSFKDANTGLWKSISGTFSLKPGQNSSFRFLMLVLVIESVDGKAISGFWQSPSCGQHCDKKERPHPCADNDGYTVDCDLFCSGISINTGDDETDRTRDLTRHSLCHTDHRGELTTCGILSITLHHHQPNSRAKLVSIELFIGCSDTQKSVFVVQCQAGLKISLTK